MGVRIRRLCVHLDHAERRPWRTAAWRSNWRGSAASFSLSLFQTLIRRVKSTRDPKKAWASQKSRKLEKNGAKIENYPISLPLVLQPFPLLRPIFQNRLH